MTQQREDLAWLWTQRNIVKDSINRLTGQLHDLDARIEAAGKDMSELTSIYAQEVCGLYHIRLEDLMSKCRSEHVAAARHSLCYAMRERARLAFPKIAAAIGRDHSSVMHGCGVVRNRMEKEPAFAAMMCGLLARIDAKIAESVQPEAMVQ